MTLRSILFAGALALTPGAAWAGNLVVSVVTKDGRPLANAVVTLPATPGAPKPDFPWKLEIAQKDKQFEPFVLIAPVGARVGFPNLDKFRHHVYSFSKGNKFELELYGREDKRSVPFNAVGVAALGCNIHDAMVAFVRIVDTPWAAKSGEDGVAEIKAAPEGKAMLTVWHPYAKARDQSVSIETTVTSGATHVTVSIDILPPPHH